MSRSFMGKKTSLLLCFVLTVVLIAGCSAAGTSSSPSAASASASASEEVSVDKPMELVVGTATESMGLDPQQMPGFGFDVNMLYEPLVVANADGTAYVPALCESMTYSDDGKTITFKLPEDLTVTNAADTTCE